MTSLSNAMWQLGVMLGNALAPKLVGGIQHNTPVKSGETQKSVGWFTYGNGQWRVTGSPVLAQLERGDDPNIGNRKVVQTYTRHTSTGKAVTVTRTYTGMRPQKLWKKSAGGGNPWRVVPMYPRPPMEITAKAMAEVLEGPSLLAIAKGSFPSTMEITSLD